MSSQHHNASSQRFSWCKLTTSLPFAVYFWITASCMLALEEIWLLACASERLMEESCTILWMRKFILTGKLSMLSLIFLKPKTHIYYFAMSRTSYCKGHISLVCWFVQSFIFVKSAVWGEDMIYSLQKNIINIIYYININIIEKKTRKQANNLPIGSTK